MCQKYHLINVPSHGASEGQESFRSGERVYSFPSHVTGYVVAAPQQSDRFWQPESLQTKRYALGMYPSLRCVPLSS